MNKQSLWALGALNLALLAAVFVLGLTPQRAEAQFGRQANYVMVAGDAVGLPQQVVWIIETTSGRMITVTYGTGDDFVEIRGRRDLARDLRR